MSAPADVAAPAALELNDLEVAYRVRGIWRPVLRGVTFSPNNRTATVNGADVTGVNFAATTPTFTISGTISPTAGGSGATVTLSGAATATTIASSTGAYTFAGLQNGTYTLTPSQAGYMFSPVSQTATVNGAPSRRKVRCT